MDTAYYYWPKPRRMKDVNGVKDNYGVVDGPFGFGAAVVLNSENKQVSKRSSGWSKLKINFKDKNIVIESLLTIPKWQFF